MQALNRRIALAIAIAIIAGNSHVDANYISNGNFSTGSTLPFGLATNFMGTAGPVAPDGGLNVSTYAFAPAYGGSQAVAVFEAGPTSGTSATPLGGFLSQTVTVPNDTDLTFSIDYALTSTQTQATGPGLELLVGGSVVASYFETGAFIAGSSVQGPLTYEFTTSGMAGGTQSLTLDVGVVSTLQASTSGFTEYIGNVSLAPTSGGGSPPPSVPEPASVVMLALGLASAGLAIGKRRRA